MWIMPVHESLSIKGGCLCGGVRFSIDGPCRDVINCHCQNCRRTHGHFAAYTAVLRTDLMLIRSDSLCWYHDRSPDTLRGFCRDCGASLFWDAKDGSGKLSIAAGSLDDASFLKTMAHVFVSEAGGYYRLEDDLPQFELSSDGALE